LRLELASTQGTQTFEHIQRLFGTIFSNNYNTLGVKNKLTSLKG